MYSILCNYLQPRVNRTQSREYRETKKKNNNGGDHDRCNRTNYNQSESEINPPFKNNTKL